MSQRNSISKYNLLFTGYYREIYPELKIKLFIGYDVISLCTCYCSLPSIFIIGVGQSGINITLDFFKQRYRDYYPKEEDILQTDYSDAYLSQTAEPPSDTFQEKQMHLV